MAEAVTILRTAAVGASAWIAIACSSGAPLPTDAPSAADSPAATIAVTAPPTAPPTVSPAPSASPPNVDDAAWVVQRWIQDNTKIQVLDSEGNDVISVSMDVDGSFPTNPDWSPDGQKLTFVITDDSGRDDLWVVNVDGSDPRWLYDCAGTCANLDDPAWSPDGKSIAACKNSHDDNHPADLISVDVETGDETTLYTPALNQFCAGPRWSPDGKQIVLEIVTTDGAAVDAQVTGVVLSIVDVAARFPTARGLTKADQYAATADWSRDTNLIVFNQRPDSTSESNDLYTIDPDGSGLTRVTYLADTGSGAYEPSFDATSTAVVFHSDGVLWNVNLESGAVELAFGQRVEANHPRVRPAQ